MVKNSEKYIKETGCEWTNTAQLPQNRWIPEGCTCEHDKEYLGSIFTSIEELLTSPQWLRSTKSVCQSVSQYCSDGVAGCVNFRPFWNISCPLLEIQGSISRGSTSTISSNSRNSRKEWTYS